MEAFLRRLALAHAKGELVPFIGSGMSFDVSPLWRGFVNGLAARVELPEVAEGAAPSKLTRAADRAVQRLSYEGRLADGCRDVLHIGTGARIPQQTLALARTPWPLVITTNYDDLYVRAAPGTRVLGRGHEDCREVLRELDLHVRPVLWAIQGYLGGGVPQETRERLAKELVIGHHQYQRVIHEDRLFRRTFAEVFRRRSLLFLGSGLEEDYFVNLFGEVLHGFGAGSRPHFALMKASEAPDPDFLLSRLNVQLHTFAEWSDLPKLLETIADRLAPKLDATSVAVERRYTREGGGTITLRCGEVPLAMDGGQAIAASFGRSPDGELHLGAVGHRLKDALGGKALATAVPGTAHLYRFGDAPAFGVASTSATDHRRDLRSVAEAMCELLEATAEHFEVLHVQLLAAGSLSRWPRVFSLVQMLRGARRARRTPRSVVIHVVEPRVLAALNAGQIPVEEILACDDVRFWIEVVDEREPQRVLALRPTHATLAQVAAIVGVSGPRWRARALPAPDAETSPREQWTEIGARTLDELGVCPGGTVQLAALSSSARSPR